MTPSVAHENSNNRAYHRIYEFSEQTNMKRRHPSSKCFVRAWGNKTTEILPPVGVWVGTSNVVCQGIVRTKHIQLYSNFYL